MTQFEIESVVTLISEVRSVGDLIKGTGGLRKTRIGLEGRGKRSGGRVIDWHHNEGFPALLLWAFAKNEASDLTAAQSKALTGIGATLLESFRSNR